MENRVATLSSVMPYVLVTLHRPSNVDDPNSLQEIVNTLEEISYEFPVIFPVHPRTRQRLAEFGLYNHQTTIGGLRLIEPLGYLNFLSLERHAALHEEVLAQRAALKAMCLAERQAFNRTQAAIPATEATRLA